MISSMREIFSELEQKGVISVESTLGCSEDEILAVERHFNCILPLAYREFLVVAGKSAGKLFCGTDIFYPRVLQLQSEAKELLIELGAPDLLPNNAKVFCMHQGYEINYFLPVSDDPPVFQYFEGQSEVSQPWKSFSEFLRLSVEGHLAQWPDLN
jgi:hypothetical protein